MKTKFHTDSGKSREPNKCIPEKPQKSQELEAPAPEVKGSLGAMSEKQFSCLLLHPAEV